MKTNWFDKYFSDKYGIYTCALILFIIAFVVFKDFILLKDVFLYKDVASDSINASYANFLNISDYIKNYGFPKWSFQNGIGQNIFSLILRDPTDAFVYFLDRDSIPFAIIFKELFKIITSGIVFYLFLRKIKLSVYVSIVGAMLYSYTGFMTLGSAWYIFTFEALMLAALLLSFEKLFQDNSFYLFPIVVFLLAISMPVNLYLYGIFLFAYMVLRFFLQENRTIKPFLMVLLKLFFLALLGLGLSSVFLFSNIKQILESARVEGDSNYFDSLTNNPILSLADSSNYTTSILRFFSNDILGTGLNFKGWYNYFEAPLFYCGILTLLLLPQLFVYLNKKQRVIYISFVLIWLLPIVFPYFRYAYWLFSGDYYRAFSLCVATCFVFVSLHSLSKIEQLKKINLIVLISTSVFLLVLLYYPYENHQLIVNKDVQSTARNFILLYTLALYLLGQPKLVNFIKPALILLLFFELALFSYNTVNNKRTVIASKELKQKVGFNDFSVDALSFIKNQDTGFYRIDKTYSSSVAYNGGLNDPQAQFYKGTSCYHSFNQKYYLKFIKGANITNARPDKAELESKRITGFINRPLLQSLFSVKYILTKQPDNRFMYASHDSLTQFGDVKVFRKKYILPLGVAYNKYILESDFQKLNDTQKDIMLFKAVVINDTDKNMYTNYKQLKLTDSVSGYSWEAYSQDVNLLKSDSLVLTEHNQNYFKGSINLNESKLFFLSIPFDSGWSIIIDGKPEKINIVDFGMMGVFIDKGQHSIELSYTVPYLKEGGMASAGSFLVFLLLIVFVEYKKRKLDLAKK
ncbi:MAG: YfhO family protein [Bacteroidia bacterium]